MTRRELRVLAVLASRPGLGLLSLAGEKGWLDVPRHSDLDDRVPPSMIRKFVALGHVAETAEKGRYAVTEAGAKAAMDALLPRLRLAWSRRLDFGPLDSAALPQEHAYGTPEQREMTDCFGTMGWIEIVPSKHSVRFTSDAMAALGVVPDPVPPAAERIRQRQAEVAERQAVLAAEERAKESERAVRDAEKEVVRLARAVFRQEAGFDDLEAAVARLEALSPSAERVAPRLPLRDEPAGASSPSR